MRFDTLNVGQWGEWKRIVQYFIKSKSNRKSLHSKNPSRQTLINTFTVRDKNNYRLRKINTFASSGLF